MFTDVLSVGMVTVIGLMLGTVLGLFIGYLAKLQRPRWSDMTGREKMLNAVLVLCCSAVFIAALGWRFLLK